MATFQKHRGAFIDIACVLFVGVAVLFTSLFAHPFHRGFFCDDDSIRYPLMSSTISTVMLACVSFLLPLTVFVGVEGVRLFDTSTPRDSWHSVFCSLGRSLYELFGVFMFGAGLNQVTVDVGKYSVGRLRPHFVAVCAPFSQLCQTSADTHQYVSEYECTGDPAVIEEARLSFPSGHAALAFYTAVYLSVFLQQRLYWRSARLPRHLLQGVVLLMAWYTALSRVHDNMHHPTDVLAGSVIGIVWALLLTTFVIDMRLDCSHATKDELRSLRTNPAHIQGANSV